MDVLGASSTLQTLIVGVTLFLCVIALFIYWSTRRPTVDFPPGPTPLPFIGNLFEFSQDPPHIAFIGLGKKYGDIFSVKIGQRWTVVLNSLRATREAITKQPVAFAGRPDLTSFQLLSRDGESIALSDYSTNWAENRKLLHASIRTLITKDNKKFENFIVGFFPELGASLDKNEGVPFNPKELICQLVYSILGKVCFGQSYAFDDPQLVDNMERGQRFLDLVSNGLPSDIFPSLSWFPFKRAKQLLGLLDLNYSQINEAIVVHRKNKIKGEVRDLIDLMLDAQTDAKSNGERDVTDDFIATAIADVFGGGTDTTIVTLYWTIALMVQFPEVQEKVSKLADEVIGRDRMPSLADRDALPYIVATVHEVLRYSTKLPLSVPHSTTKDTRIDGYSIPKGTMIFINIWAIHRDQQHWKEPYSFRPEHFLDETGTVRQHPEGFLPFSTGRRVCMGESMVKAELFLIITWLFQHYKFTKVPGTEDQSYIEHGQVLVANEVKNYSIVAKKRY